MNRRWIAGVTAAAVSAVGFTGYSYQAAEGVAMPYKGWNPAKIAGLALRSAMADAPGSDIDKTGVDFGAGTESTEQKGDAEEFDSPGPEPTKTAKKDKKKKKSSDVAEPSKTPSSTPAPSESESESPSPTPTPTPSETKAPEPSEEPTPTPSPSADGLFIKAGSDNLPCVPGEEINQVNTSKKQVALTIDDGPSPSTTQPILDVLSKKNVEATFFFVGSRVETSMGKDLADKALKQGHQVGVRGYGASQSQVEQTFTKKIGGLPYAYRAQDLQFPSKVKNAAKKSGQCLIGVSENGDTRDTESDGKLGIIALLEMKAHDDAVVENLSPGMIIRAHDASLNQKRPVAAAHIAYLIDGIKDAGYELVTVDTLLQGTTG